MITINKLFDNEGNRLLTPETVEINVNDIIEFTTKVSSSETPYGKVTLKTGTSINLFDLEVGAFLLAYMPYLP